MSDVVADAVRRLEEILHGIDCDEAEGDYGWWATTAGADFGAGRLAEVREFVSESLGAVLVELAAVRGSFREMRVRADRFREHAEGVARELAAREAVIEAVRALHVERGRPSLLDCSCGRGMTPCETRAILSTAPSEALRADRERVWDEGNAVQWSPTLDEDDPADAARMRLANPYRAVVVRSRADGSWPERPHTDRPVLWVASGRAGTPWDRKRVFDGLLRYPCDKEGDGE